MLVQNSDKGKHMLPEDCVTVERVPSDEGIHLRVKKPMEPSKGALMDNARLSAAIAREREKAGYRSQAELLRAMESKTGMQIDKRIWSHIEKDGQMPKYDQIVAFCMTVADDDAMQLLADLTYHMLPEQWREKQQGFVERMKAQDALKTAREAAAKMQALLESAGIADDQAKPRQ